MDHVNALLSRAHGELDDWLEHEHLKGGFALIGSMWDRHPSWGADPTSASYLDNRWSWHQNLGELFNFHGTAHVRNQNVNGVVKKRLAVTLAHPDTARLEAVKVVSGGSIDVFGSVPRLRMEDRGAFLLIKAGRLFIDPANHLLYDVLNMAQRFYTHIPEPGAAATDAQLAGQESEESFLIPLLTQYRARGPVSHDCLASTQNAGWPFRRGSESAF